MGPQATTVMPSAGLVFLERKLCLHVDNAFVFSVPSCGVVPSFGQLQHQPSDGARAA